MEPIHSKKLQYFMKFSVLLDRSFFVALLLICFTIFALCISLYYNAKNNANDVYTRKAQTVTVSLATLLDSYFSRIMETQKEFIEHSAPMKLDEKLKNKIDILAEIMRPDNVKSVTLISREMKPLYSAPDKNMAEMDISLLPHIMHLGENKKQFIGTPFYSKSGCRSVAVMTQFFDVDYEFEGALSYLIDLDRMVKLFFKDIDFRDYENAWIFDQTCSMISNPQSVLVSNKRINIDRRRFMTYALAKQHGTSSYYRVFPGGLQEKYIVCFSSIPLDGNTKWVICVEAPAEMVLQTAEGFPIVYSVPLLLFFLLIVALVVMKRYFARRYVGILENVIVSSRDVRKEIESRLAAIMDSFPYIIFETDRDGFFTFLNVAPERISGIEVEILHNKNIKDLVAPPLPKLFSDAFMRLVKDGHQLSHVRVSMQLGDSKNNRVMSVNASPVFDDKKNITGTRGVMHDITERVELELNLIQSQKMDAVGMLTSGIAHDFNNYLSTMLGYITMMKMKGDEGEDLDALEQAAKNAAKLTGQLMSFSRNEENEDEESCADLNENLSTIIDILRKSLPYAINLNHNIDADLPEVRTASAKIDQIVMNLIINARDAMPDGGEINVKAWSTNINDVYSEQLDLLPGKYVILEVEDSGKGLTDEIKNRVFEPYFTTKKSGTGLGLATVYAIVKNFGGNILVKSSPGKGTLFAVYIPQTSSRLKKLKVTDTGEQRRVARSVAGAVLIVDDDEMLSRVMEKSFKSAGYKVFTSGDGKQGLQIYEKNKKSIDIIISDVIMEQMNGIDMVRTIREQNSSVAVLFITGRKVDKSLKAEMDKLRAHVLNKPFEISALVEYVDKCFTAFKEKKNDEKS